MKIFLGIHSTADEHNRPLAYVWKQKKKKLYGDFVHIPEKSEVN